jgi:hypothetical protein
VASVPSKASETGQRLRLLREALGYPTQKAFSAALGIEFNRWNNIELGAPLSIRIAVAVVNRFGGLTLDYLYCPFPWPVDWACFRAQMALRHGRADVSGSLNPQGRQKLEYGQEYG